MPIVKFIGGPHGPISVSAQSGQNLLELAEASGAYMGSACGGVCACSSCHCRIVAGADGVDEASDAEEDRLDMAFDVRPSSRLGCQVKVQDSDLEVELTEESIKTWYNEHPDVKRPE